MKDPDIEGVFSVMGFSFSGAAPNQGLIFTSLKPFAEREGDGARAQGGARRASRPAARASAARSSSRSRRASIPGPRRVRRVRVPGARPGRHRHQRAGGRDVRRWSAPGNSVAAAARALQLVHRQRSAADRSRSIASGRWRSGCRSARSRARCRSTSGRSTSTTSTSTTAPTASTCRPTRRSAPTRAALKQLYVRNRDGADAAARERRPRQGDDGAAGHQPLQPVPVGDDQRIGRARLQLGAGAAGNGAARRARRCRRA